jgi:hypothetical protein
MKATDRQSYSDAINLAAHGVLVMHRNPDLRPVVYAAIARAVDIRGGATDGRLYRRDIAGDVLAETFELAMRLFATEFSKRSTLPDHVVARVEQNLSDALAGALAMIRERLGTA